MEATANIEKQIESALREDNAELLKPFLESKDRQDLLINYRETRTRKALMVLAAEQGRLEIVRLLLTILDVNVTWRNKTTLLMLAAKNHHLELVKLLLEKGASVNAIDFPGGLSALHFACRNGHEEIVKILYQYGATIFNQRPDSTLIANETLENVFAANRVNIVHAIVNNEKKKKLVYRLVLFAAVKYNNIEFVKLMLDRGVSIETTLATGDFDEGTPLILAVRKSQPSVEIVELLLKRGADVSKRNSAEFTVLHNAVSFNDEMDIMRLLLKYGADINATAEQNVSPLCVAVKNNKKKATKFLLSMGAGVNMKAEDLYTIGQSSIQIVHAFDWQLRIISTRNNKVLEAAKIVVEHIVKLQSEGRLSVNEDALLEEIRADEPLNAIQSKCEEEIDKMKAREKFSESNLSLYDIFTAKDVLQLAAYAKNREMADYLPTDKFREDFPIYSETILENFGKGVKRNYLQARVCNFFTNLFTRKEDKLPRLPVLCASEVFSYLSDRDLCNLRRAYY